MKITEDEVRYVADLANLRLTADEITRMRAEMDEILTHIGKLNELDTAGVAPMTQVLFEAGEGHTLRDDTPRESLGNAAALANAPVGGQGYFKIPRVIER